MKKIFFNKNYIHPVNSIQKENQNTLKIIENIYSKCINEQNYNHKKYAEEVLENFRYLPSNRCAIEGSYIRCIDLRTITDMSVFTGGFVVEDNGYKIIVRSCRSDERPVITFNKNKYAFFIQMTMEDQLRELQDP